MFFHVLQQSISLIVFTMCGSSSAVWKKLMFKSPFSAFHHLFGTYITMFGFKLIFICDIVSVSTYFHFSLFFTFLLEKNIGGGK